MSSWMLPSSVRLSISSRSKSAAPWKIGSSPDCPVITGKSVTWTRSTRPAAISARFIDRLPCERNGTSDSFLEPRDDVDGVTAHDGRVRPVEGSFQCGRHHRCRHAPHPGDPWVTHLGLFGARGQHPRERPIRVGPEDHPLLLAVQGKAVVEQLRALLAPVAAPVAAVGAVAVKAGKDVEGIGSGHDALLECG